MAMTREDVELILSVAKEMGITQKNDPASLTLDAQATHGVFQGNSAQYGLFSDPTARPQMFSTYVHPRSLLDWIIRRGGLQKSEYDNEILEVMSGITAASGTNATGWCGNPPSTPDGKKAKMIFGWGSFYAKTRLNALPELGARRHRGDVPREILNAGPNSDPITPSLMWSLADTRSQLGFELYKFGAAFKRSVTKVNITGDRTQSSAATEWGWIQEYSGLDGMIKTGYTDADSQVAVKAMDSWVVSFNADVGATVGGSNIVQAITDAYWTVTDRARAMNMDGVEFGIAMRPEQFRPLVEVWACTYSTYRCVGSAALPVVQDANQTYQDRTAMLNGQYLIIDGQQVPVVFDEGIVKSATGASTFFADIYILPISWMGIPLLKMEYFDMDNPYLQEFADFVSADKVRTLNNGLWLVGYRDTGLCMEYHFAAKLRLIIETPWLAARIDDVHYTVRTGERLADPSDTFTHANGGRSYNT